ncbi:MAG: SagB/ThcOx family dehydrogenase [Acidihalobacter sp.]
MSEPLDTVLAYHRRTQHHFRHLAAGPPEMDWANQPDPFRRFEGCARHELPLLPHGAEQPSYAELYHPGSVAPRPLSKATLGALFELAFGLSAWKQYGPTRWALRSNPSSGNLHPTEAYLIAAGCRDLDDGLYHYVSRDHLLERRCAFQCVGLPPGTALLGLTSIHWREAWKYGERAYRYCQHDAGHALAAVRYAAATLGWRAQLLDDWGDAGIAALLGTDRAADFGPAEREHPDLLLRVDTAGAEPIEPDTLLADATQGRWQGRANRLSQEHAFDWPVIDEVAAACSKPRTRESAWSPQPLPEPLPGGDSAGAIEIIKRRRSAQAFDGTSGIAAQAFYRMLDLTLPRPDTPPWDAVEREPRLHLLLFVHRVEGLVPGLYLFVRRAAAEPILRESLSAEFAWERPDSCPEHLRLYRLLEGDARPAARTLSCHQDIAADGAFSLGMLAEYAESLERAPCNYRRLHWEAGMLGQVLYLEAESAGLRGTGIGCFFDPAVHELAGIEDDSLQTLYHFTLGGALEDQRLQTLPAYAHLDRPAVT